MVTVTDKIVLLAKSLFTLTNSLKRSSHSSNKLTSLISSFIKGAISVVKHRDAQMCDP